MLRVLLGLVLVIGRAISVAAAADGPARFAAPTNQGELDGRMRELRKQYEPFLRSLPAALPKREVQKLTGEWKFAYEAKETPKVEGIPAAPAWHGVEFDDGKWEVTTVPEWRYRTREGDDTARNPEAVAQWKNTETTADTICWYRTTFAAGSLAEGQRLWLCFDGVEWEAQVWLNGELLGTHRVYYEPFRFNVTGKIKESNTLAVRVISGRSYGQPVSYWGLFPDVRAQKQRYSPGRAESIPGNLPIGYHAGCGFGIFRDVYLEKTGPVRIGDVFVRNDLSDGTARIKVELDGAGKLGRAVDVRVEVLPENFQGQSYEKTAQCESDVLSLEIPMPEAKAWSPDSPNLYRCRVMVNDSDGKDVLFGCRSFAIVHGTGAGDVRVLPEGMFLLNGKPLYLRGTNIQGLNAYWYWGQTKELQEALLMLKAANFNAVRSCQHVEFPEVREWMDRLGILSEQDQGGGYRGSIDMGVRREQHIHTGTVLARQTYNNPGVVLLCFGNEHEFPAEPIVRAVLAVDPQRIVKPISGRFSHSKKAWDLPEDLRANAIDDGHAYPGWYGNVVAQTWKNCKIFQFGRMVTLGEFGAEALDSYETMRDHYPAHMKPPAADADTLWAASQVQKHDVKQIAGLGRDPKNLGEYIEASQGYQEALLADKVIGMRLSPRAVAGYFQFYFMDVVPAFWPKAIVSFDHRPKKAYFQMAQVNQPMVALPQLTGDRPDAMTLWVANDLDERLDRCTLEWSVIVAGQRVLHDTAKLDVPAVDAARGPSIDLKAATEKAASFELNLVLRDAEGRIISRYRREVRCVRESQ